MFSNIYLCRTNRGFPRHLKTAFFPSGILSSLTSIFAKASTSPAALIEATKLCTTVFAL